MDGLSHCLGHGCAHVSIHTHAGAHAHYRNQVPSHISPYRVRCVRYASLCPMKQTMYIYSCLMAPDPRKLISQTPRGGGQRFEKPRTLGNIKNL